MLLKIFTFLLILQTPICSTETKTLPSDAQALLSFKQNADIHNTLHFNTSISHCEWQGVECFSNGQVFRLIIENQNLGGVFSQGSLTRLDQLRVLSLNNNSLTGPIPDLSGLLNLKSLFLHHNHFTGNFPPSIKSLHRIRAVDLSHNGLTGELPTWLTQLDRLYCFRVESNRFSGPIPGFNQTTLSVFNVSTNTLSGPVPVTPVLSQFGLDSYSHNPSLCGKILHKVCTPVTPFFSPGARAPLSSGTVAAGPGASAELAPIPSQVEETGQHGVGLGYNHPNPTPRKHGSKVAEIIGFASGVTVLIGSIICFTMAVRKQRKDNNMTGAMASDYSAAIDAAAVMRLEEEREEKVKSAQQQIQQGTVRDNVEDAAKGGSLVFCAGENELYTLEQLMRASAELLGRGTIGTTYKAVLDNSLIVCVKRLDSSKLGGVGTEAFQRHMDSVGALRHPNLVPLRCYFQAKDEKLLVYDYQPNGSLFSLIHGSKSARAKPLHWTSCLKIAEDVAQGLSYIHQAWRLVHGNLKSTNVLLGSDFEACVTDYCLDVLTESSLPEEDPNLLGYKAPEIRQSKSEGTPKSDVYAFGVLLLELLTGKPPSEHPHLTPRDIVLWVRSARGVEDGGVDEQRLAMLLEVATVCSVASPEQRPNMWQVLKMLQDIKEAVLMDETELGPDDVLP